jgi:hypothetical protein
VLQDGPTLAVPPLRPPARPPLADRSQPNEPETDPARASRLRPVAPCTSSPPLAAGRTRVRPRSAPCWLDQLPQLPPHRRVPQPLTTSSNHKPRSCKALAPHGATATAHAPARPARPTSAL